MNDLEAVTELLASQNILTLATVDSGGIPSATPLFYILHNGLALYWVSAASSLHSRSLINSPQVSAAVALPTDRWKQIRGVQMRGAVRLVEDSRERKEVLAAYAERFSLGRVFRVALTQIELYCLTPTWIRLLDNSRHFGYKREFTLPPA